MVGARHSFSVSVISSTTRNRFMSVSFLHLYRFLFYFTKITSLSLFVCNPFLSDEEVWSVEDEASSPCSNSSMHGSNCHSWSSDAPREEFDCQVNEEAVSRNDLFKSLPKVLSWTEGAGTVKGGTMVIFPDCRICENPMFGSF